jgi:hypothetical protein
MLDSLNMCALICKIPVIPRRLPRPESLALLLLRR